MPDDFFRPRTRRDCALVERPCCHVWCRHNLFLEVRQSGSIKINRGLDPTEATYSCALDIAEEGGKTLAEVGEILNLSRERVRQIEAEALRKYARARRKALACI